MSDRAGRENGRRARAGGAALRAYADSTQRRGVNPEGEPTDKARTDIPRRADLVCDLIVDLAHWCDRWGVPFDHVIAAAELGYTAELIESGGGQP